MFEAEVDGGAVAAAFGVGSRAATFLNCASIDRAVEGFIALAKQLPWYHCSQLPASPGRRLYRLAASPKSVVTT
jgi:hypothetical protein